MRINWFAVLTGFLVTVLLGIAVSLLGPITGSAVYLFAIPGLVGGFVAGYLVSGLADGAVHGGLATVVGGLILLAALVVSSVLFAGLLPALGGAAITLGVLFVQAIPGAIAGAVGGWAKGRQAPRGMASTAPR